MTAARADSRLPVVLPPRPALLLVAPALGGAWMLCGVFDIPMVAMQVVLLPAASLLAYWAFVRFAEHRRPFELAGGWRALAQLALGGLLAFAQPAILVALWYGLGVARLTGLYGWHTFGLTLDAFLLLASVAVFEELVFRGLILRYLELALGSWPAIVLSAALFALVHLLNTGMTPLALAAIAIFGLASGAAYVLTRRLWLSIGLHAGHNLALAAFFGSDDTIQLLRWAANGSPYFVSQSGALLVSAAVGLVLAAVMIVLVGKEGAAVVRLAAWQWQVGACCAGARTDVPTRGALPPEPVHAASAER